MTDRETDFKHGGCDRLENGRDVQVKGRLWSDGIVRAEKIEFSKGKDDEALIGGP